jgi:ATP-dependent Clp protease ATP-binding subunit ClpC
MTGEEVHCFSFEENYAWRLSWAPSGSFLAASLSGDTVRIFDTRAIVHPRGLFARPTAPTPLTPDLEPLPGALAALARLGLATPLSLLRSLLGLLAGRAGDAGDEEPLAILARHPGVAQLAALRWPAAARPGLLALLLRHLPRDAPGESRQATLLDECRGQISAPPTEIRESEGAPPPGTSPTHVDDPQALGRQLGTWAPPPGTSPTELRDALAEALGGEPIAPQAPPLPLAALTQAADSLDERLFTLLELVGSEAVAADPGLPLRLLPQVSQLPALGAPQRRLLGLRLRLDQGGPSHGSGLGAERTGIDLRGDLRALLPSQLALPDAVLRARHLRGDLLYRARDGREPPRLKPTVLLLDVSPPTFGPVEAVTRLAAHAVASSLLEAGLPAVLITAGGEGSFHPLERREDLVEIWIRRSLEEAQEARALAAARAMAETLRDGALEPIVLVLSHAFFGAEAAHSPTSGLRGLFVSFPGRAARPTLAEACERWEVLGAGEIERLHHRLGELVG